MSVEQKTEQLYDVVVLRQILVVMKIAYKSTPLTAETSNNVVELSEIADVDLDPDCTVGAVKAGRCRVGDVVSVGELEYGDQMVWANISEKRIKEWRPF